jgi:hypothetical protein
VELYIYSYHAPFWRARGQFYLFTFSDISCVLLPNVIISQLHIRYGQNGYVVFSDNEHDSEKSVPVFILTHSNREFFSLVTALSVELTDLM